MSKLSSIVKSASYSFKFFYNYVGNRLFFLMSLSFISGLLDSVGITLLIPLLLMLNPTPIEGVSDNPISNYIKSLFDNLQIDFNFTSLAIFLFLIFSVKSAIKYIEQWYKIDTSAKLLRDLRISISKKFGEVDYVKYSSIDTGKIINTSTTEVERTVSAFIYFSEGLLLSLTAIAYLSFVFFSDAQVSLFTIIVGIVYFLIFLYPSRRIKKISQTITNYNHQFNGLLIQSIQSFKYLSATNTYNKIFNRIKEVAELTRINKKKQGYFTALIKALQEPLILFFILTLIYIQVNVYNKAIFSIIPILILFQRAFFSVTSLQTQFVNFNNQFGGLTAVRENEKYLIKNKFKHSGDNTPLFNDSIQLKNVNFSYGNKKTLHNINLNIVKNSTIAFVGPSGSGKSTLIDLITGIIEANSGSIELDKLDYKHLNIKEWQSKIGYLTQESIIFTGSAKENISFFGYADNEQMNKAIANANALFLFDNEKGLDAQVGDRGSKFSGGQKQRLAIAREFYKNPSLLILDEATSALDSESELAIKNSIDKLKGQITIIMIAHRLSTVKDADVIHVLNEGKIIESGSYKELMENENSNFAKLVSMQSLS